MKKLKQILSGAAATMLSVSSLMVLAPAMVHAAVDVCTWTGASDGVFSLASNWNCTVDGAAVPGAGDSLVFDTTGKTTEQSVNNDIVGASFNSITVQGSGSASYVIEGSPISLAGGINVTTTGYLTVESNLVLTANQTFRGNINLGASELTATLDLSTFTLTFGLTADPLHGFYIDSVVSGSGPIVVDNGSVIFSRDNTFTGSVTVNKGTVGVNTAAGLGTTAGNTIINSNSNLAICAASATADITINEPLVINTGTNGSGTGAIYLGGCGFGGGASSGNLQPYKATLAGPLTITQDVTITTEGTITITGPITGHFDLELADGSDGKLVINSSNNGSVAANGEYVADRLETKYEGNNPTTGISVSGKATAIVTGSYGDTFVAGGGILKGTGTVKALSIDVGGTLAPGMSPGCLSSGNLTFTAGSTYEAEIGGVTECTEYDQMKVTGTVNLGDATLNTILYNGFKPAKGQSYKIIDNDGADAVSGTFKDLGEGATVTVNGYVLKITYKGGDGNDVVLSVQTAPGTPDTGFSLITANPIVTLAFSTVAAGALFVLARRSSKVLGRR